MQKRARHPTTCYCLKAQADVTTVTCHELHDVSTGARMSPEIRWLPMDCSLRSCGYWNIDECLLFNEGARPTQL